jgi:signal transduction histidine kinase/DNA-binding response OmpR family regulator
MKKSLLVLHKRIVLELLCFIFFACIFFPARGQTSLPPAYTITSDTAIIKLPDSVLQIMPDPEGNLNLQQVIAANHFHYNKKINYKIKVYWQRFQLINRMQKDVQIALPEVSAYADLYTNDGNKWTHARTGTEVQFSKRSGLKQIPAFTLTIPAGKSLTLYKKIYWDYVNYQPDSVSQTLCFTQKLIQRVYVNNESYYMTAIQNAFLIGMFVLSIIINFYFFLAVHEKEFLWFCLFVFLFSLASLSSLNDVFLREYPKFQLYLYIFSRSFAGCTLVQFVRYFLKTFHHFPRWDKYLIAFNVFQVAGLLAALFASSLLQKNLAKASHTLENIIYLGYSISLFITLLLYIRKPGKMNRLLVIALMPILLLSILTYTTAIIFGLYYPRFGAPDVSGYTSAFNSVAFFILILCYLWMMVFFTWVLFLRFSGIRKELAHQREIDSLKTKFFANISHEFRTPLTLIMGPVEDFLRDNDVGKFKNILPEMHRNSNRLLQLINQLLDLSKLGGGNYQVQTIRDDIIPFIKQIVHSFSSLAQRRNIQLETEVDPHLKNDLRNEAITFYFDDDIVEKILYNLLSNAFKFTPDGGSITVSISLPDKEKKFLELKVEDNGVGIPKDKLPFIFNRFYQADDSNKRQYEGTGIGLSLVKELVELHEGRITVTSEINKGTAFSCYLPLNKKINTKTDAAKSPQPQLTPVFVEEDNIINDATITKNGEPVILIAEDQQDVRKYIREKLVNDYKMLEAKNGVEALTIAKEQMPDLIISDVMMPKMDGFELCKLLKTDNLTSHIPVILLTARAEETDKLSGLETGADAYLIKPFNAQELKIRVNNLIAVRNKMRAKFSEKLTVKPSEIAVTSRDRLFMQKLLSATESHIADEQFSVAQLAAEANMSTSQINRKLKAIINQSAQQFIRSVRMQRALELLKSNSATVSEIAYQVGFSDPGYFARVFKTHFGYLPSEIKSE